MIPQTIAPDADSAEICALVDRWQIAVELGMKLHQLAARLPFGIKIISGFRDAATQAAIEKEYPGAAPQAVSTHTSCPATGADLDPFVAADDGVKVAMGTTGELLGLRWGGGARRKSNGIPEGREWRHFDLGPRRAT